MDEKRLLEIIGKGETIEVELKQSFHSVQEIAKTICAFANTEGGILILGVTPKGKVAGISQKLGEVQEKVSASNSIIHPKPAHPAF